MAGLPALFHVAYFIVLPILILIGVGFVLQRKFGLDMPTLARLNVHVVVPAMVFTRIVASELSGQAVITVIAFHLVAMAIWAALSYGAAALRGVDPAMRRAMVMTSIFYNSGNYGLPLQNLAFRDSDRSTEAESYQVFAIVVQNVTSFTLGVLIAAGRMRPGEWKHSLAQVLRFPSIYALGAALLVRYVRDAAPGDAAMATAVRPVWDAVSYAADAMVLVALLTLGAQLGTLARGHTKYPVTLAVLLRLVAGPAVGLFLIWAFGLEGLLAQVMLISTSFPTSVNCLLICLEFKNHPDFVARSVFYSTVLSPITVTLTILLARSGWI